MRKMSLLIGRLIVAIGLTLLFGCVEVDEHYTVHSDGAMSIKAIIAIDPQYEALVLPKLKEYLQKEMPQQARIDYSQRINGKAAIIIEFDESAAELAMERGGNMVLVSDAGFMRKRYEYRSTVTSTPDFPFPHRAVVSLPGSIEGVTGGKVTAKDTVEFDETYAKRGTVFVATSTAYAFNLGRFDHTAATVANPGTASWLVPASIGSILAGGVMLLTGWLRSRRMAGASDSPTFSTSPRPLDEDRPPAETIASVFCTECGSPNAIGRKFCSQCGNPLE